MPPAISINTSQHRNDSTILPIVSISGYLNIPFIKLHNWQYFAPINNNFLIIPNNRYLKNCKVELRDCKYDFTNWTRDTSSGGFSITGISGNGFLRTGGDAGGSWNGAYYNTQLTGNIVTIQATAQSVNLSAGISLQDYPFGNHNYFTANVAHCIIFGQDGQLSIREKGNLVKTSYFKYDVGDVGMIEYNKIKNTVSYYLVKGKEMILLRTTRPKLTTDPVAEMLLFLPGSSLKNVLISSNSEVSTEFENVSVAIRKEFVQAWQLWKNQRTRTSNVESIQLADGEFEYTYPNSKTIFRQLALTPKSYNAEGFHNFEDFFNWHGDEKEFIFIDLPRKDAQGNPQEFWAKFLGGINDTTGNGCLFDYQTQIIETFRNDYIPRKLDRIPPSVAITSIVTGSAVISGTASDNVLLTSLQLYQNGNKYGETFLPDSAGNWTKTVPTVALVGGNNYFYVIATDYGRNTTQSNTVNYIVDTVIPTVAITSPTAGQTVSGIITISATATDNVGVARVEFYYYDGAGFALISSDATSPYSATFDTSGLAAGNLVLSATAFDAQNNPSNAAFVTVSLVGASPPTLGSGLTVELDAHKGFILSWSPATES
jgi:hypothetical protein